MQKEVNLDADLTPFTKIKSKWIIDLNMEHKTIKLLEGNRITGKLLEGGFSGDFLKIT